MINLSGEIKLPLEEFWCGVFDAIRESGQDAGVDDILVHPDPSLLKFMASGEICGFIVSEDELHLSPDQTSRDKMFVIQSEWLYKMLGDKIGLASDFGCSFGRPRLERNDLVVDFAASTEGGGPTVKTVMAQWYEPQNGEGVLLSEFARDVDRCRHQFVQDWVSNNAKHPEAYPFFLPKDNAGLWWESFNDFDIQGE